MPDLFKVEIPIRAGYEHRVIVNVAIACVSILDAGIGSLAVEEVIATIILVAPFGQLILCTFVISANDAV
ncbi:hypothetical protein ES703_31153 [subsurface metagenome]